MAARLGSVQLGTELPAYVAPQAEIRVTVKAVSDEQVKSPAGTVALRKYDLVFQNPGGPLPGSVTVDTRNRLARVEIPAAGLSVDPLGSGRGVVSPAALAQSDRHRRVDSGARLQPRGDDHHAAAGGRTPAASRGHPGARVGTRSIVT